MKKITKASVVSIEEISQNIFSITLHAPYIASKALCGQFLEIYMGDKSLILPRPISICDVNKELGEVRIVFMVVGKGTKWLTSLEKGKEVSVLGPLGNSYVTENKGKIAVIGGGIGLPPLLYLTKELLKHNDKQNVVLFAGFKSEPILIEEFESLGIKTYVATDDGKFGFKGNVLELLKSQKFDCDYIYSCGPHVMLKNISKYSKENNIKTYISLEERMACGFGACLGCVVKTVDKTKQSDFIYKRVCHEGPIFEACEVIFDE